MSHSFETGLGVPPSLPPKPPESSSSLSSSSSHMTPPPLLPPPYLKPIEPPSPSLSVPTFWQKYHYVLNHDDTFEKIFLLLEDTLCMSAWNARRRIKNTSIMLWCEYFSHA
uniref:Uncharacterized protein n=1 Tax=Ditylum brightwellii TaxID=49249 RepID=A0A6U3RVI9_9STRA